MRQARTSTWSRVNHHCAWSATQPFAHPVATSVRRNSLRLRQGLSGHEPEIADGKLGEVWEYGRQLG